MARLLTLSAQPRAVFCATDIIAAGAVFEARRRGVRVPEEMAVAGFDDLEIAGEIAPALTTVRVPRYEIGRQAARLIQMRLSGETPEHAVYDLGFELVQRESA
jgi:LacI family gluconate utilization system Gnt-I transcriptional repressor